MKIYKILTYSLSIFAFMSACKKEEGYLEQTDSKANTVIYVSRQATAQKITLYPAKDTVVSYDFGASFAAVGLPSSNIAVKFKVDDRAFDSVNVVRASQNLAPYLKLPADAYTISGLDVIIPSGGITSNLVSLKYNSKNLDPTKVYMLPISISDASGYNVNPLLKTMFITTVKYKAPEIIADRTGWGITASTTQAGDGTLAAVLDGDLATFWHSQYSTPASSYPHWIQVDMLTQTNVTSISMAPRSNNATGFTKFNLKGSVDGAVWIDLLTGKTMDPSLKSLQNYELDAPTKVKFLKLEMTEGPQAYTHLAEFQVFKVK
ncbi:discoidin domain-containing protein [Pedobacter frigoris]|uniref:discoidin domain-containing protein n=1 Tax=Pedobacter frigoris TaxID=2571272 RepID=UPI002931134C|nr:discoidin domain-containing protein [Pedobacter frigoris]